MFEKVEQFLFFSKFKQYNTNINNPRKPNIGQEEFYNHFYTCNDA